MKDFLTSYGRVRTLVRMGHYASYGRVRTTLRTGPYEARNEAVLFEL